MHDGKKSRVNNMSNNLLSRLRSETQSSVEAMLMQQDVGRELIRIASVEKSSSMEWKISFCGSFGKQITRAFPSIATSMRRANCLIKPHQISWTGECVVQSLRAGARLKISNAFYWMLLKFNACGVDERFPRELFRTLRRRRWNWPKDFPLSRLFKHVKLNLNNVDSYRGFRSINKQLPVGWLPLAALRC